MPACLAIADERRLVVFRPQNDSAWASSCEPAVVDMRRGKRRPSHAVSPSFPDPSFPSARTDAGCGCAFPVRPSGPPRGIFAVIGLARIKEVPTTQLA